MKEKLFVLLKLHKNERKEIKNRNESEGLTYKHKKLLVQELRKKNLAC